METLCHKASTLSLKQLYLFDEMSHKIFGLIDHEAKKILWRITGGPENEYLHMKVSNELIDKLSTLARLKIDPQQKESLRADMQQLIGFIEKLQELDTTGIQPLMHMTTEINQLRADEIHHPITHEEALQNAVLKDEQFFLVPKVIKKQ